MSGHTDERDEAIRAFCLEGRLLVDDVRPLILGLLAERDELRAACLANSEKLGQEGSRMSALIVEAADRAEVAERRVDALEAALAEAERVLRVVSGWNTDRVSTADAIAPARAYVAARAAVPAPTGDDE